MNNFYVYRMSESFDLYRKNAANGILSVYLMTKAQESCNHSQSMILRFNHFTY